MVVRHSLIHIFSAVALFSAHNAYAQEEPPPDAYTLMREVWEQEERLLAVRGTHVDSKTVTTGGIPKTFSHKPNNKFALEFGNRFWYQVNAGGANGYTISATRSRVTRQFPQMIEDFPLSVWESEPFPLSADVFSSKVFVEMVLRPLHGQLGLDSDESALLVFKSASVSIDADHYLVQHTDQDADVTISFTISRKPVPHLTQVDVAFPLVPMTYRFEGQLAGEGSQIWVTTEYLLASGNFRELRSVHVDWESVNSQLPDDLFVIDDKGLGRVDYNRILPRLQHWVSNDIQANPTYSYLGFRELFPRLFVVAIVVAILFVIGIVTIPIVAARRVWRGLRRPESGE